MEFTKEQCKAFDVERAKAGEEVVYIGDDGVVYSIEFIRFDQLVTQQYTIYAVYIRRDGAYVSTSFNVCGEGSCGNLAMAPKPVTYWYIVTDNGTVPDRHSTESDAIEHVRGYTNNPIVKSHTYYE